MQEKELIDFLEWVDKSTHFFEDKDVTVKQVVSHYLQNIPSVAPIKMEWEEKKLSVEKPIIEFSKTPTGRLIVNAAKYGFWYATEVGHHGEVPEGNILQWLLNQSEYIHISKHTNMWVEEPREESNIPSVAPITIEQAKEKPQVYQVRKTFASPQEKLAFDSGFAQGYSFLATTGMVTKEEMFKFGEWLSDNYFKVYGGWYHRYADQRDIGNIHSTSDLYTLFKNR